jgi:hypothetical protein
MNNEEIMKKVVNGLLELGWSEDGYTQADIFRLPTHDAPVYGGIGGKLITLGNRLRLKRGIYRVTIGKRKTCFYTSTKIEKPTDVIKKMITFSTKEIDKIFEIEKEYK